MFISSLSMMFEILEPCRVLRLGTSSKKIYIIKQTKIMIKIKIKIKKGKKRANTKKRANKEKKQVRKKREKRKISCLAEKPTCF